MTVTSPSSRPRSSLSVRRNAVLADTLFYPEGGGQPADHGRLGDAEVLDVQKRGEEIRHFLSHPVAEGSIQLELDWPRRWDHMQQHTGQHVLTAVALRDFGWRTTAFHLGTEWSDIELDVPNLDRDDLDRLEEAVAKEIRAARPVIYRTAEVGDFERLGVRSRLLPDGFEGAVRLVDIEGLDLNTCGGTHCRSTAEIGLLSLLGTEPMRGGTRVFFVAAVVARYRRRKAVRGGRAAAGSGKGARPRRPPTERRACRYRRSNPVRGKITAARRSLARPRHGAKTARYSSWSRVSPRLCSSTRSVRRLPRLLEAAAVVAVPFFRARQSLLQTATRRCKF